MTDQWQVLYGAADGSAWYVLRGVYGRIPPQEIGGLPLLGETHEIIRGLINFRITAARNNSDTILNLSRHVTQTLARELGTNEARLTDYANDNTPPNLSSTGWGKLAKAHHFTTPTTAGGNGGN